MADTTTELEVLDQIVDVLGGQSGQYETVVPVLQQIKELLAAGITDPEAIAEAVTAWLDEHPEATTTVQDGSITGVKIADDTIPDAKLVQTGGVLDKVAQIDGDIYTYGSAYVKTDLSTISEKHSNTNASVSNGTVISLGTNNSYDTYTLFAASEMVVYVDAAYVTYYALCVGTNPGEWGTSTITCDSASRVRKSEGNLPTELNPLTIAAGSVMAITVTKDATPYMYVFGTNADKKAIGKISVSRSSSEVVLSTQSYEVTFTKLATAQGHQWNITKLCGAGSNVIPTATDMIGVLQFVGKANFMGGVHGNEDIIDFKMYANGDEVEDDKTYNEIHLVMISHLYDVDDSTQNVVDRYVDMVFTPTGWTSRVTFKVLIPTTIQVAYASGMFGFVAADASEAYTNVGAIDLSSTVARSIDSPQMKEATINLTDNLTLTVGSETGDKGFVTYRSNTQSFKVYFPNASEQQVSAGDFITGRCEYKF